MKNTSSNKSFFNKIWNKFKNHLMVNFKTNEGTLIKHLTMKIIYL